MIKISAVFFDPDNFGMALQEVAGREAREEWQGEQDGWRRELPQLRTTQSPLAGPYFAIQAVNTSPCKLS
jgi:hypothetical protein